MARKKKEQKGSTWAKALEIAHEASRKAKEERMAKGIFPLKFMRLTLTDDANKIVGDMGNKEFAEFVSDAIVRYARRKRMPSAAMK